MEYDEEYFEGEMDNVKGYENLYQERGRHINNRHFRNVDRVLNQLNATPSNVLDIGCAYGYFLELIQEKLDLQPYGVDVSGYAIKQGKSRDIHKTSFLIGDGLNIPFSDNSFDMVTAFDIIEHFKSLYDFCVEAKRVLRPDGLLFVSSPDIMSLKCLVEGEEFHAFQDETHKYLFTPVSLKFLLRRSGLTIEYSNTFFYALPSFLSRAISVTNLGSVLWVVASK